MALGGASMFLSVGVVIVALLGGLWYRKAESDDILEVIKGKFFKDKVGQAEENEATDRLWRNTRQTHYIFFTHHKTGTNLMQRICNRTALLVASDQCAFCPRLVEVPEGLSCAPDDSVLHGPLRGRISRFTLVSSVGWEVRLLAKYNVSFIGVHMTRHPEKLLISAHQYNKYLATQAGGQQWRWDMSAQEIANASSTREELEIEAKAIVQTLVDMKFSHQFFAKDPRVLTLDLEHFERGFNDSVRQMFNHMLKLPVKETDWLVANISAAYDPQRWSTARRISEVTAPREVLNRSEAVAVWKQMEEEGHPDVQKIKEFVHLLGYE